MAILFNIIVISGKAIRRLLKTAIFFFAVFLGFFHLNANAAIHQQSSNTSIFNNEKTDIGRHIVPRISVAETVVRSFTFMYEISGVITSNPGYGTDGGLIQQIDRRRDGPFLIRFLIAVIIYSIFSMLVLLLIILLHRNKLEMIEEMTQELKERYQELLMDYLFDEDHQGETLDKIKKVAGDSFKRQILMSQMKDLMINLSGDAAEKLKDLYYRLDLDRDSEEKAFSKKWHIKVRGFRELALMNVTRANDEIVRCLHSRNSILRMEAQLALVRLGEEDRYAFLDHLERPFTPWEQLNVHQTIVSHNLEIPKFERWLSSSNPTVVNFSLRMITLFNQKKSWEKVAELLDSPYYNVREEAIKTLGELRIKNAIPLLKQHYKTEKYENSLEIVKAIRKMPDESVLNFLKLVIDKEDDIQLQIEAAKAIYEMGEPGIKALRKIMKSEYKNYQIIIKHVLDRRI